MTILLSSQYSSLIVDRSATQINLKIGLSTKQSSPKDTEPNQSSKIPQNSRIQHIKPAVSTTLMTQQISDSSNAKRLTKGSKREDLRSSNTKSSRRSSRERWRNAHSLLMSKIKTGSEDLQKISSTGMVNSFLRRNSSISRRNRLSSIEKCRGRESRQGSWVRTADALSKRRIDRDLSLRETTTISKCLKELTKRDSTPQPLPIDHKLAELEWDQELAQEVADMALTTRTIPGKMILCRAECSLHRSIKTVGKWAPDQAKPRLSKCSTTKLRFKEGSKNKHSIWLSKDLSRILTSRC